MNPQKALDKAKIGIMLHGSIFLSTVAFSMRHYFNDEQPTARTNGRVVEYNTEFFMDMTPDERVALIAHEAWHVALTHMLRCGERDALLYNKAGDYVINQLLKDDGFTLHHSATQDDQYRNLSTNQVYELLKEDPEEQPTPDNQDIIFAEGDGDGEGNDGDGNGNSKQEIEAHVKGILVKAMTQSKIQGEEAGNIPGEIGRLIDDLINPKLPWNELLLRFLTETAKDDYTWRRPNKRFMPEFYLPTQYSESLTDITIAIDTSGSITTKDLTAILSEINFIKETFNPKNLTIIDCDYQIHNVFKVTEDMNVTDLKFTGGGGTSCNPVFEYCKKHPTKALIYFTDLYLSPWTEEVDFPVLWIVYDNPRAKVHVGEITHYDIKANHG